MSSPWINALLALLSCLNARPRRWVDCILDTRRGLGKRFLAADAPSVSPPRGVVRRGHADVMPVGRVRPAPMRSTSPGRRVAYQTDYFDAEDAPDAAIGA